MSAPPDPPDPRWRLPKGGGPAVFDVRSASDVALGLLTLAIVMASLAALALSSDRFGRLGTLLIPALLVVGAGYAASPLLVRRIVIADGTLAFHPARVEVRLDVIARVRSVSRDSLRSVQGITLAMRRRRLRWRPGRLLWVGDRLILRLAGADGSAIHAVLEEAIAARSAAP